MSTKNLPTPILWLFGIVAILIASIPIIVSFIDLRKPFTISWKMSLESELLDIPAEARGSYTIRVPHVGYTVTCRNGMEANALADGLYYGEVGEFGWVAVNGRMTGETVLLDGSPVRANLFNWKRFCAGEGGGAVSIKDAPQITLYFRPA